MLPSVDRPTQRLTIHRIKQYTHTPTGWQSLCRCDTMMQGEPLEAYVRRISQPSHEPRPEQAPGKPQHDEQKKKIQAAAGHGGASQPQFGRNGRGGGVSPRVLAEGLLAASMEA